MTQQSSLPAGGTTAPRGALSGVRILDFTWALAGPWGTLQLSDLGAEVVKVEHPGIREDIRGLGPHLEGGVSTFFLSGNRGKKGIAIDFKYPEGLALIRKLAAAADVVAENFRPGTMDRIGIGYEALKQVNPRIVYAALSGFGQYGPYSHMAGVDAVAQAMGGTMELNGEAGGPPLRIGVSIGDLVGGLYLALAIMAALRARDLYGEGQMVDVSLMDAQVALCENAIVQYSAVGATLTRMGSRLSLMAPFGPYPTADGYVVIGNAKDWEGFCAIIDRLDLADDPRFSTNRARIRNQDALDEELHKTLRTRTSDEWFEALEGARVCSIGKVNTIPGLFHDPHVAAREMLVDVPLPYGLPGTVTVPNSPMKLSATPARVAGRGMPEHGQHTDEILTSWAGVAPEEIAELRVRGIVK